MGGRAGMGLDCHGPSLSRAEFVTGRDVPESLMGVTRKQNKTNLINRKSSL